MVKTKKINKPKITKNIPHITSNFESGNIIHNKTHNNIVDLEIRVDPYPKMTKRKYNNWFYFKVSNLSVKTQFHIYKIRNYFNSWKGYTVCYSYDNIKWNRLKTQINIPKKKITWDIIPEKDTIWFAYYPPYPFSKSTKLLPNMTTIGYTKNNQPILMKKIGSGLNRIWIISGQHPGETINSWILDGFVKRMLQKKSILKKYTFFIIPNANPDGNIRGNWYVNGNGINLNRDWFNTKSNEVKSIKSQMAKYGYDLVFDLHGDEGCKKHFLVDSYNGSHPLYNIINKKNKHFQINNNYTNSYMNEIKNTLDDYTKGITIEGAMKHPLYNNTVQEEPLKIGKDLLDTLNEII